ncbi:type II toxin-antitoxin system VapB family antitoxin [Nonomuraea sp. SMC257]|uniref:Type II toxin-antitoxin system VapB family antitoxin n=1 Tax=Nonomuraea montanisoli TaxID=2741721 RepID=A0A7Y6I2L0_9ACTN|nr:type II toxin-antitoxin system VapB family antitoxin [Nonomuraea montanisoli]
MRTVIDIDKELLEAAQRRLGVTTMKETVHTALRAVLERDEERAGAIEAFEFWRTEGSPDLLDPEIMKGACQRPE